LEWVLVRKAPALVGYFLTVTLRIFRCATSAGALTLVATTKATPAIKAIIWTA
jgi:hypothetical protein